MGAVVERLEEERGFKLWHIERARYDGFIASVAGRSTFDESVSAGRKLSLEEAVDYATRPRDSESVTEPVET
jgi:hypothetical protein